MPQKPKTMQRALLAPGAERCKKSAPRTFSGQFSQWPLWSLWSLWSLTQRSSRPFGPQPANTAGLCDRLPLWGVPLVGLFGRDGVSHLVSLGRPLVDEDKEKTQKARAREMQLDAGCQSEALFDSTLTPHPLTCPQRAPAVYLSKTVHRSY